MVKSIILAISLIFSGSVAFSQDLCEKMGAAAKENNLDKIKTLVEKKGADVNCTLHLDGRAQIPLVVLVTMEEKLEIASYLLLMGANPNSADAFGMTVLMWAAYHGDVELVKLLLNKGAIKDTKSSGGMDALSAAQEQGFTEIIELLK